jgi:UDP-N-acetylglucosamine:LPS N-acetylglucosamine transferase
MPLLEKLSNPPPIDVVVTDYYANQIWLHPNIRHLFVATEEMKTILISRHSSIIVSGIPLNPVFFEEKNIEDLQKKYQIVPERPTILFLWGVNLIFVILLHLVLLLPWMQLTKEF